MLNADITSPSYHIPNLLAEQTAMSPWQMPLPVNQWILELQDMHNTVLSMLQRCIVDYARGPGSKAQKFIAEPKPGAARQLCGMIRARADGRFSNISTYGLALTLAFGTLVIVVNLAIVDTISWVQRWRGTRSKRHQAWLGDNLHQLQRQVFEARGQGVWKGEEVAVPVTVHGDMISRESLEPVLSSVSSMDEEKSVGLKIRELEVDDEPAPGRLRRSGISRRTFEDEDEERMIGDLEFGATLTEQDWEMAVAPKPKQDVPKIVD